VELTGARGEGFEFIGENVTDSIREGNPKVPNTRVSHFKKRRYHNWWGCYSGENATVGERTGERPGKELKP